MSETSERAGRETESRRARDDESRMRATSRRFIVGSALTVCATIAAMCALPGMHGATQQGTLAVTATALSLSLCGLVLASVANWAARLEQAHKHKHANPSVGVVGPRPWPTPLAPEVIAAIIELTSAGSREPVLIVECYQRSQRGSKAIVQHLSGARSDTWFWRAWVTPGTICVITGSPGFGAHNHNPDTLYVGDQYSHGILGTLPGEAWAYARWLQQGGIRRW